MSIVPVLASLVRELDREFPDLDYYHDDDFGFGLHPLELVRPRTHYSSALMLPSPRRRYSPYERALIARRPGGGSGGAGVLSRRGESGGTNSLLPTVTKDGSFQVCMDVSQFKPNELNVKVVDRTVVVEGKHEEREDDHGLIQRHFVRKYTLPKDYEPKEVVSTISSDGVLTVKAPPPASKAIKQNEHVVHIQQTGPAHLSVKAPAEEDATNGEQQQQQQQQQHQHQQKVKAK